MLRVTEKQALIALGMLIEQGVIGEDQVEVALTDARDRAASIIADLDSAPAEHIRRSISAVARGERLAAAQPRGVRAAHGRPNATKRRPGRPPGPAKAKAVTASASAPAPPAKRRATVVTSALRKSRKIQGKYLSLIRQLPLEERATYKDWKREDAIPAMLDRIAVLKAAVGKT